MRPGYHRKRSNPVENIMRPGILSLALIIGFGITYVLSPGRSLSPALSPAQAGQMAQSTQTGQNALMAQNTGTGTNETYEGDADARHRECIYVPGIDGFKVIDNKHLTVSTSPRRIYLITLWNRCHRLKWAHQIAIKSTGSWTCSHSRDMVLTDDQRCMIDDIERVDSFDAAKALVAERNARDEADDDKQEK